jgi:antitoxin component YwqK of YwqJK toxin-antitoxin module
MLCLSVISQEKEREEYHCESCPKHLKYYEYWDEDSTIINARGHYCHGLPCKTWRYYHQNGKRRMKVKYGKKLKIKYFRDNGRLEKKGYARWDLNKADVHFYWHGRWKYFDDKRKLYRIAIYQYGEETELVQGPEYPLYFE